MIPVPLTSGPDLGIVEALAAEDPTIQGMWCVPRFATRRRRLRPETVERLAAMPTAAPDFTLFWDNAYGAHILTDDAPELASVLEASERHGNPNRPFVFGSTSKITLAGAGSAWSPRRRPT